MVEENLVQVDEGALDPGRIGGRGKAQHRREAPPLG
jgi:hypothetical protein